MDTSLGFGDGHALHAVDAALVFEVGPHTLVGGGRALRADRKRDVLETAELRMGRAQLGNAPAVRLGVAAVHARQVGGKQRRFFAAFTGFDFEDDVHRILGVAGSQDFDEGLVGRCFLFFEGWNLASKGSVFGSQFAGSLKVPRRRAQPISGGLDAAKLSVPAADAAHQLGVRQRLWISHLGLHLRILLQQRAQCAQLIRRGHDSPHPYESNV